MRCPLLSARYLAIAPMISSLSIISRTAKARSSIVWSRRGKQGVQGVALNAGAYTHTSLALADCLAWIGVPCVEVHLSNVLARSEPLRQKSYIGRHVIGVVAGFGMMSYALALQALVQHHEKE